MPASPLVSVIMPVYNASAFLTRAVQSLQNQTFEDFELLIIDDCSTDDTVKVVQQLAKLDKRIRLFQQTQNGGPSVARNRGLTEAKGKWIAILDADDAYTPQRLERLMATVSNQDVDMIADNLRLYDAADTKETGTAFNWGQATQVPLTLEFLLKNDRIGKGNPLGWIKPIFKKSFLEENNITYPVHYRHGEDFYLYINVLLNGGKALLFNEPHYIYTTRVGASSGKQSGQSKTKTDVSSLAKACNDILNVFASKLTENDIKLLNQRKKDSFRYQATLNIRHSLHCKDIKQAIFTALNNPNAAYTVARSFAGAMLRRLK